MQRLALFIDEYDAVWFQNLLNHLEDDALIIHRQHRQQQQQSNKSTSGMGNIHRHYSLIRHVQVYQWQQRHELPLQLYQAHWDPPARRTRADKQAFYSGLARGIPQLENLSLRNCSREDLIVCAECYLSHHNKTHDNSDNGTSQPNDDAEVDSSSSSLSMIGSKLEGIFVVLAEGEGMDTQFLQALAKLPRLASASICIDHWNEECDFSILLQSTTLKSLEVERERVMQRRSIDDTADSRKTISAQSHVIPLCRALTERNQTLRSLDIEHDLCIQGLQLIIGMLKQNSSFRNLTVSFQLPCHDKSEPDLDTTEEHNVVSALCDALRCNQTLLHFQNRKANLFHACDQSHATILSLLEDSNYTLRVLDICSEQGEDQPKVRQFAAKKMLYLKLNSNGRGKVLKAATTSKSEWIELLHPVRDDLDSLFYFVSKNPSIVSSSPEDDDSWRNETVSTGKRKDTRKSPASSSSTEGTKGSEVGYTRPAKRKKTC